MESRGIRLAIGMREIDGSSLTSWKSTFAKDGIIYRTDQEYLEAISNLVGFFEILIEIDQKNKLNTKPDDDSTEMYVFDKDGNKIIL
jgi:hypothetical protein